MSVPRVIPRSEGFTLIELMISMAIVILLLLGLVSITDSTRKTWSYTTTKVSQFRDAREAFEAVTRKLSQATLNTYLDYEYPVSGGVQDTTRAPLGYVRQSELRFICGNAASVITSDLGAKCTTQAVFFQAPTGCTDDGSLSNLNKLLNTCGFYVEFGDDSQLRPDFVTPAMVPIRYRFRLMEMVEPAESLTLYKYTNGKLNLNGKPSYNTTEWFNDPLALPSPPVQVRAENIVALIFIPKLSAADQSSGAYNDASLAPVYRYDSTGVGMTTLFDKNLNPVNQLPPIIQVTMVAVDEASFSRFQIGASMPDLGLSGLFQTVGDTSDATKPGFAKDLKTLTSTLERKKINYRVFTTNVSIKGAKWSREQSN